MTYNVFGGTLNLAQSVNHNNTTTVQVYIVTMEQEKEQQRQKHSRQQSAANVSGLSPGDDADDDNDQEFGDYIATDGESLLSLVQPEMKMLSHHWLSALKDYALLSLPPGVMSTRGLHD